MKRIEIELGGTAFTADDAAGLADVTTKIDALAKRLTESPRVRRHRDFNGWLALAALGGLMLFTALRRGPWLVIPG